MSEKKEESLETLQYFRFFKEGQERNSMTKFDKQESKSEQTSHARESNYTFKGPNPDNFNSPKATFEMLSNQFSLAQNEKDMNSQGEEALQKNYFLADNVSFGKKSDCKIPQVQDIYGARMGLFSGPVREEPVNLYSKGPSGSGSSRGKDSIMETLKTSSKSKKSKGSGQMFVQRQLITEFSSGKSSKKNVSQNSKNNIGLEEDLMIKRTVGQRRQSQGIVLSIKDLNEVRQVKQSRSSLTKPVKNFQDPKPQFSLSNKYNFTKSASSGKHISPHVNKIFNNKRGIIKAFEIGKRYSASKLKKLSLDFSRQKKPSTSSLRNGKNLSIHVNPEMADFQSINRQYFSTKNSNALEKGRIPSGKSGILKMREKSGQDSGLDPKKGFSNFGLTKSLLKEVSGMATPSRLFSKYLYRRKSNALEERWARPQSRAFKKKKGSMKILEVAETPPQENNYLSRRDTSTSKIPSKSPIKTSSRKLISFFNQNNVKLKTSKLIAKRKISKGSLHKKKPDPDGLLNRSSAKLIIDSRMAHESLNENSMLHIQNRVDIETLINSKLLSSRSRNILQDKSLIPFEKKTPKENKSETSILASQTENRYKQIIKKSNIQSKERLTERIENPRASKGKKGRKRIPIKDRSLVKVFPQSVKYSKTKHMNEDNIWNLYKKERKGVRSKDKKALKEKLKSRKGSKKSGSSRTPNTSRGKKIVLRKSPNVIISTRKTQKTPDFIGKKPKKRKLSKKMKSGKLMNSVSKKKLLKKVYGKSSIYEGSTEQRKFFKTHLNNSKVRKEGVKSYSSRKESGSMAQKILLFKNIKEKLTSSFKKKGLSRAEADPRTNNAKSSEPMKKYQFSKKKFNSQKKMSKLKLGNVSPNQNFQNFKLRAYSKTPNHNTNALRKLVEKWPHKRTRLTKNKKPLLVESVSYMERSPKKSGPRQRDLALKMVSLYSKTPNGLTEKGRLRVANLFSKRELQTKIKMSQKENLSKINLSIYQAAKKSKKISLKNKLRDKSPKYKNLVSIKFNKEGKLKKSRIGRNKSLKSSKISNCNSVSPKLQKIKFSRDPKKKKSEASNWLGKLKKRAKQIDLKSVKPINRREAKRVLPRKGNKNDLGYLKRRLKKRFMKIRCLGKKIKSKGTILLAKKIKKKQAQLGQINSISKKNIKHFFKKGNHY